MVLPDTLVSAGRIPLVRTIASPRYGKYFCTRARSEVGRKQGLFFQGPLEALLGHPWPFLGRPPRHDLSAWTVNDDWPERVPVTAAEVDVF